MNDEISRIIVNHCSPVLLGCKPAALFTMSSQAGLERLALVLPENIALFTVRRKELRLLVLIYEKALLEKTLFSGSARGFLADLGYPAGFTVSAVLGHLRKQFFCQDFPHEVGLFLGYPLEDVLGFVEHKGQNYKFRGYWKVYGDVDKAKSCFRRYDFCRQWAVNFFNFSKK